MRARLWVGGLFVSSGLVFAACSSTSSPGGAGLGGTPGAGGSSGSGTGGAAAGSGGGTPSGGTGGGLAIDASFDGAGGGATNCVSGADEDQDQDGFSVNEGDCNDCDVNVNPGAIDVESTDDAGVATMGDEDCDGTPGSTAGTVSCDANLALEDIDPLNAARAIELCKQTTATDTSFGLLEAKWVRANGDPYTPGLNVGLQPSFGVVNTIFGDRMLAISSGNARTESQVGACGIESCPTSGLGVAPMYFPQDNPACPPSSEINDDVALEVKLRAPTNATGYQFNFRFYSFEYPEWVCDFYNDQFIALVSPAPTGAINGNICFDSMNNPVSVNLGFFDVCDGCPAGPGDMVGTGFNAWDDAGATIWLQTQAPVEAGKEVTIRFAIWDTGDDAWDSTALIDNFKWIANGGTVTVGTTPIPIPR
jgi:hypothetical protein